MASVTMENWDRVIAAQPCQVVAGWYTLSDWQGQASRRFGWPCSVFVSQAAAVAEKLLMRVASVESDRLQRPDSF